MANIERLVEKKKVAPLIRIMKKGNKAARIEAIHALGRVKDASGFSELVFYLNDPDTEIRRAVAEALGSLGDGHAKAHLDYAMYKEDDPVTRETMHQAMISIKDY